MSRMNSRTRKKLYPLLAKRDGEICHNCKIPVTEKQLVIDHKNNNNSDNSLENLQLLCKRCNFIKNPKIKPVANLCVDVREDERPMPPEMEKNMRIEPMFRRWLFNEILGNKDKKIRYDDALYTGAESVNASPETIRRYLRKMTSRAGLYVIVKDAMSYSYIHLKENV